jgi:hypothetical protein
MKYEVENLRDTITGGKKVLTKDELVEAIKPCLTITSVEVMIDVMVKVGAIKVVED